MTWRRPVGLLNGNGGHLRGQLAWVKFDLDVFVLFALNHKLNRFYLAFPYFGLYGPEWRAWAASFFGACRRARR